MSMFLVAKESGCCGTSTKSLTPRSTLPASTELFIVSTHRVHRFLCCICSPSGEAEVTEELESKVQREHRRKLWEVLQDNPGRISRGLSVSAPRRSDGSVLSTILSKWPPMGPLGQCLPQTPYSGRWAAANSPKVVPHYRRPASRHRL
jgi:hypothetical protein